MKEWIVVACAASLIIVGQVFGWPPSNTEVVPQNPTTSDVAVITITGTWPDTCIPNASAIFLDGNDIYFDVIRDYPPGTYCLQIPMGWQRTESVGPLSLDTYTIYAGLTEDPPSPPAEYIYMMDFIVSDKQFVLSTETVIVPEGSTEVFTIAILRDPCGTVEATVAHQSGDPDITVQSGALLTFNSSNYSVPQPVTLAAAEDEDILNGEALIQVTATEYLTANVTATEADNETSFVLYVDTDAPGFNTGTSWTNAFTDLQEALSVAAAYPDVEEIRIAQGVYTPTEPAGDRNAAFHLLNELIVKGGYAGFGEPYPDVRDISLYKTTLSGDLNGNDIGDLSDTSRNENSYNVVRADHVNKTAVLDGFIVTAGNGGNGSGIYASGGTGPTIKNCILTRNRADNWGGGMYNRASCVIFNCIFSGNAANQGGGMYTYAGSPTLTNCTLSGNLANGSGGGLYVRGDGGNPKLTNCILWSNVDSGGVDESAQAHVNYTYESVTTFNFCCIQGWTGNLVGISNIDDDPCFADPCNGDYHLKSQAGRWDPNSQTWVTDTNTSPCIDAGDPDSPIGLEPFPNGGRVNMGTYGGTAEASKSYFGGPICEIIVAGDINGDCKVDGKDLVIMALHWLVNNNP